MIPLHDDNPTQLRPYVTLALIVICGLTFLWQQSSTETAAQAAYSLGAIPSVLFDTRSLPEELVWAPPWVTVITSMFLHGGWMHLIGNMLYLWIFGNNVEDAMGHIKYVVFYLTCGVVAVFAHAFPNADSVVPMVGASGAISGVLGAYLLLYPRARVLVLIPLGFIIQTIRLPAGWVLAFWFALQLFSVWMSGEQPGGVAWGAHIGGFVAGLALIPVFKHRHIPLLAPARERHPVSSQ